MGEGETTAKVFCFEDLTRKIETLLTDGYIHNQLVTFSYDRKRKEYGVKVKGSQKANEEAPWMTDVRLMGRLSAKFQGNRFAIKKATD
jgi:hypothetical protein